MSINLPFPLIQYLVAPNMNAKRNRFGLSQEFDMNLLRDLGYGLRQIVRRPFFSLAIILTLAVGIGPNVAIFSVLKTVMLEPLPYPEPERLVRWWETTPSGGDFSTSQPNFLDYRDMNGTFDDMAAGTYMSLSLVGDGELPDALFAFVMVANTSNSAGRNCINWNMMSAIRSLITTFPSGCLPSYALHSSVSVMVTLPNSSRATS